MSTTPPLKICYFNACLDEEEDRLLVFGRTSEGNLVREMIQLHDRIAVIEPHIPLGEYHKNIIRQHCTDFPEDDSERVVKRAFNVKIRSEVEDVKTFFAIVSEFADITNRRISLSTSMRDSGIKMMEYPELLKVVIQGAGNASVEEADIIITQTRAEEAFLLSEKATSHEVIISMEGINDLLHLKPFNGSELVKKKALLINDEAGHRHLKDVILIMLSDLALLSGRPISMLSEPDLWRDIIEGYDWRLSMTEVIMKKVPAKTLKQGVFRNINGVFLDDELWKIMDFHEPTTSLARYLRKVRFFPGLIRTIFSIPELCLPDYEAPMESIGIVDDLLMMEGLPSDASNYNVAHSWDILAVLSPGNAWGFSEEEGFSSLGRYSQSIEFPALRDVMFRCLDISLQVSPPSSPNFSRILKSFSSGIPAESLILDGSLHIWWSIDGRLSERIEDIDRDKYMKILEASINLFTESLQRSNNDNSNTNGAPPPLIHYRLSHSGQNWRTVHRHGSHAFRKHVEEVHRRELSGDEGEEQISPQGSEKAVRVSSSLPEQDV